jgi:outer membrane protein TolC
VQASADYAVGASDSRNVAEAAQAYVQMRVASFDARYRHNVALAELAKVTGGLDAAQNPFYPSTSVPALSPQADPTTPGSGGNKAERPESEPTQALPKAQN